MEMDEIEKEVKVGGKERVKDIGGEIGGSELLERSGRNGDRDESGREAERKRKGKGYWGKNGCGLFV